MIEVPYQDRSNSIILGLDISTTTIGMTLLDLSGNLIAMDYVKPTGSHFLEKVDKAASGLRDFIRTKSGDISQIYAEQPNLMFRSGMSSAQTIAAILRFNGALLFTLYQKFGILPMEVMAVSARKQVIGIGRFAKGLNTKEEVFKWVQTQLPNHPWPTIQKGKNQGKPIPEVFDMSDSYVVARYGVLNEQSRKN